MKSANNAMKTKTRYWYTFDFRDVQCTRGLMGWCFGSTPEEAENHARKQEPTVNKTARVYLREC